VHDGGVIRADRLVRDGQPLGCGLGCRPRCGRTTDHIRRPRGRLVRPCSSTLSGGGRSAFPDRRYQTAVRRQHVGPAPDSDFRHTGGRDANPSAPRWTPPPSAG